MDFSKLADAAEAMRRFVDTAAGGDKDEERPSSAVPTDSAAVRLATTARQSYQKTARWMLAAFAAVGVLIFGSLPFAAIADVELTWPASLWLVGGLLLAVAGIVSAVVAVSLVNEPEDASLGELDCDLRSVQKTDEKGFVWVRGKPVLTVNAFAARWNPRLSSRIELVNILHGPDSSAHLGPNLESEDRQASVTNLIKKLGELESTHAKLAPRVARQQVVVDACEKRVADLAELPPSDDKTALYTKAAAQLDEARTTATAEKEALAEVDNQLKLYHDHRDLVLAEAGVMQLRGTFRLARRILALAAVLTLFGGTGYALALPGATTTAAPATPTRATPPPAPPFTTCLPATVVVHEGTAAARDLPRECVDTDLAAVWVGRGAVPSATGPFTAVVTEPPCTGEITVARGEGRFALTN